MSKVFSRLARFLAVICAIVFGVTLLAALLLVNAEARLFKAVTYKGAMLEQNLYQRMPKLLAEQLISNLTTPTCQDGSLACLPPGYLRNLTVQNWEELITALIPPEQMQTVSEQSLDSLFTFLDGKNENPVIVIKPIKQTLAANATEAVTWILSAQPACSAEQITDFSLKLLLGQPIGDNILCNPPQQLLSLALPLVTSLFNAQISAIPDTIPMFAQNRLEEVRTGVGTLRMIMRLSPLLPLVFLALLTMLAVYTLTDWLKWWGFPLVISSGLALLASLVAWPITRLVINYASTQENSFFALRLAATALDVVQAVIQQVTTPMAIEALIILLAGAGMLAGDWYIKNKHLA